MVDILVLFMVGFLVGVIPALAYWWWEERQLQKALDRIGLQFVVDLEEIEFFEDEDSVFNGDFELFPKN